MGERSEYGGVGGGGVTWPAWQGRANPEPSGSFIHSFIHSLTHSFIHSFIQ